MKESSKMYLVSYSTGSFDDWCLKPFFVTYYEDVAKAYCEKFNRILAKAKEQYGVNEDEWYRTEKDDVDFRLRQHEVYKFNEASYSEIQER